MEGYVIKFSGAIRFTDEINIGIYIYENTEDPTDIQLVIVNEVNGEVIYPAE